MLSSMDDLRVLIVAGGPLARARLMTLLTDQLGFTVIGRGAGDADLLAEVAVYRPDVVAWDLGWDPAPTTTNFGTSLERLADLGDAGLPTVAWLPAKPTRPMSEPSVSAASCSGHRYHQPSDLCPSLRF